MGAVQGLAELVELLTVKLLTINVLAGAGNIQNTRVLVVWDRLAPNISSTPLPLLLDGNFGRQFGRFPALHFNSQEDIIYFPINRNLFLYLLLEDVQHIPATLCFKHPCAVDVTVVSPRILPLPLPVQRHKGKLFPQHSVIYRGNRMQLHKSYRRNGPRITRMEYLSMSSKGTTQDLQEETQALMTDVRERFPSLLNGLNNTLVNWVRLEAT
ncbi:uncharacterized protein LOC135580230 [Columba livia]|uniref:uncharacterized protein LOC135580230 n=1 Tax=Columba livia TaxID=8932 RepID=UPI0031BA7522